MGFGNYVWTPDDNLQNILRWLQLPGTHGLGNQEDGHYPLSILTRRETLQQTIAISLFSALCLLD